MLAIFEDLGRTLLATALDILPIVAVIVGFQLFVLRKRFPHPERVLVGGAFVLVGLALFLIGLDAALFPLGELMAKQLSAPEFVFGDGGVPEDPPWTAYLWVYAFALLLGFATTIAEPALMAVALKAEVASRGNVKPGSLRIAVAIGVGIGVALGTVRIVVGISLPLMMAIGYAIVVVQTAFAPRALVPLAYDSGCVATSTVTVPLVAALGLGLATTIPGRDPALDGFGLIAFAALFPMMVVMGYAQIVAFRNRRLLARAHARGPERPDGGPRP